jgi:hypothetical protein
VIRDARNTERIKILCRDEAELQRVKAAAEKTAAKGVRVLRDQLYQVKVDNVEDNNYVRGNCGAALQYELKEKHSVHLYN